MRTFDYGQHGGLLYIVAEFLPGHSLDKALPIHGSIPLRTKLTILQQVRETLEYAHQQNVMHRDIKPGTSSSFRI